MNEESLSLLPISLSAPYRRLLSRRAACIIGVVLLIPFVGIGGLAVLANAGSCGTNAPCITPADNAFLGAFAAAVLFAVLLLLFLLGGLASNAEVQKRAVWVSLAALVAGPFVIYFAAHNLLMGQARASCDYVESCLHDDGDD